MTSVVDTSVKHFHSGMSGAPVLSGQAGKLIDVFNACLADGFDVKAVTTLVVSGGIATLSFVSSHSATVDSVILVDGSSIAALNGEQKVTAIDSGKVMFATAAANGTASGSITFKMAPAGFAKPFTDTNLAVYKSLNVQAHGMFFQLNDADATNARIIGYENMTAVSTGTGLFPSSAQISGGGYWNKANTANANPVDWELFSDGRTVLFKIAAYTSDFPFYEFPNGWIQGFGDGIALRPAGDPYATFVASGSQAGNSSAANSGGLSRGSAAVSEIVLARPLSGVGTSVEYTCQSYCGARSAESGQDNSCGRFPSPVDGGIILSRRFIAGEDDPVYGRNYAPRADMPGLLSCPQNRVVYVIENRQIITPGGALAGRRLMALWTGYPSYGRGNLHAIGAAFIDITGPWR